nr:hypothetical protein [Chromobacterium paludis]
MGAIWTSTRINGGKFSSGKLAPDKRSIGWKMKMPALKAEFALLSGELGMKPNENSAKAQTTIAESNCTGVVEGQSAQAQSFPAWLGAGLVVWMKKDPGARGQ